MSMEVSLRKTEVRQNEGQTTLPARPRGRETH